MAYDRYDRDERPRWRRERSDRYPDRNPDRRSDEERGFFERAGDQIASWFGDDDDRRDRSLRGPERGYIRNEGFAAGGRPDRERDLREREPWGRDDYRRTRATAPDRRGDFDPHYDSWRQRQLDELDRDYDEYRRENQSRFESEFTSWRERRQQKRAMLGQMREHMEVVGSDNEHVGTIDRVAGERLILTKSDGDSGGAHHSLSCADVERIEGDRVILECSADQARKRWRDENRSRALFEREDQGDMGPRILDRSFEGTYR